MESKMSNPTPTGEWWTEQDVDGCWHIGVGNRGFAELDEETAKAIADAHNAALAAEREQYNQAVDHLTQLGVNTARELQEQLAAEREKVQALNDALKRISKSPFIVANMVSVAQDALAKEGK